MISATGCRYGCGVQTAVQPHATPGERWTVEQVFALAPKPSSVALALPLAIPARWAITGCDDRALWGRFSGASAEPYDIVVDHVGVGFRCSCPSRAVPCKHALGLLVLWVNGHVAAGSPPGQAAAWIASRVLATTPAAPAPVANVGPTDIGVADVGATDVVPTDVASTDVGSTDGAPEPGGQSAISPPLPPERGTGRDERVARMHAGLVEFDRWICDRIRTGLADPSLAHYATWDAVAARLIDAQVGGLANRLRRLGGTVGTDLHWHQHVLAELGLLHLLVHAGLNLRSLPPALADSVAATVGWQVRQADVLGGVPDTAHWQVLGRSDVREDRIEVRRFWMRNSADQRWAMLLSFAAYGQSLDTSLHVGSTVHADLYRYPGALGLRALIGLRHSKAVPIDNPIQGGSIAQACAHVGNALAAEPWIERYPVVVVAAPTRSSGHGAGWVLSDHTGSLPIVRGVAMEQLLACSGGAPSTVSCEWTPAGLVPLTIFMGSRCVDLGPTADDSFVGAA